MQRYEKASGSLIWGAGGAADDQIFVSGRWVREKFSKNHRLAPWLSEQKFRDHFRQQCVTSG
jgi:hypothetical protein